MAAAADLVFRGGTVVAPDGLTQRDLFVRDGRIVEPGDAADAATAVDATGLLILPGMVDTHVHMMDPGATEREDAPSATSAAAVAGVTTVVEHTHVAPVRSVDDLREKRAHLTGRAHVDFGLAAHVWPDRLADLADLWFGGITFFKIFTCTTHGVPGLGPRDLHAAFSTLASVGAPALVHCEDEGMTARAEAQLRAAGRADPAVIREWRHRDAELAATSAVIALAEVTGARVTVAHVSNQVVAQMVAAARARGVDVAAEACPQYFLLRDQDLDVHGPFRKFTPPARAASDADEEEMWQLLRDGAFTHLSSDHAPATVAQKHDGSIWDVHFGLPGLDTTAHIVLDAAVTGRLKWTDVVRLYSQAPAERYGLAQRKGHLGAGADADIVLFDPSGTRRLTDADVRSKAGWTPYAGRTVHGQVVGTWLAGTKIADGHRVIEPWCGQFVAGAGMR